MKFGIFVEWPNPDLRDWPTVFQEGVDQIILAEEMGYEYAFLAEHHFSNYGMSPAPLVQAAHILQRTSRIKVVTTCLVLPEWPPLRLAEEVAVLDNIYPGRFICGVGRGYQPYEFARHGLSITESQQRFNETLDILKLAWTSKEDFTYQGKYLSVPHPTKIWPNPYSKPHPAIWLTTSSEAQIAWCAREGIVPLTSARMGPASVEPAAVAWVQGANDVGRDIQTLEMGLQTHSGCAATEAEARELLPQFIRQTRANKALQAGRVKNGACDAQPWEGENTLEQAWERLYCGTPDMLIQKYGTAAKHGITMISTWLMSGCTHQQVVNSLKLIGKEVIPALKDLRPDPAWITSLLDRPRVVPPPGRLGTDAE